MKESNPQNAADGRRLVYVSFANTASRIFQFTDTSLASALKRWRPETLGSVLFYESELGGDPGRLITLPEIEAERRLLDECEKESNDDE